MWKRDQENKQNLIPASVGFSSADDLDEVNSDSSDNDHYTTDTTKWAFRFCSFVVFVMLMMFDVANLTALIKDQTIETVKCVRTHCGYGLFKTPYIAMVLRSILTIFQFAGARFIAQRWRFKRPNRGFQSGLRRCFNKIGKNGVFAFGWGLILLLVELKEYFFDFEDAHLDSDRTLKIVGYLIFCCSVISLSHLTFVFHQTYYNEVNRMNEKVLWNICLVVTITNMSDMFYMLCKGFLQAYQSQEADIVGAEAWIFLFLTGATARLYFFWTMHPRAASDLCEGAHIQTFRSKLAAYRTKSFRMLPSLARVNADIKEGITDQVAVTIDNKQPADRARVASTHDDYTTARRRGSSAHKDDARHRASSVAATDHIEEVLETQQGEFKKLEQKLEMMKKKVARLEVRDNRVADSLGARITQNKEEMQQQIDHFIEQMERMEDFMVSNSKLLAEMSVSNSKNKWF